jgi:hypothetical protein
MERLRRVNVPQTGDDALIRRHFQRCGPPATGTRERGRVEVVRQRLSPSALSTALNCPAEAAIIRSGAGQKTITAPDDIQDHVIVFVDLAPAIAGASRLNQPTSPSA